jgi:protein required for attachment to host cells
MTPRQSGKLPEPKEDNMLIPHGAHVMVVDGAKMALFRNAGQSLSPQLDLVEEAEQSVPRTSSLGSDQPGRGFQSANPRRAAYETTDFHQMEEDEFAEAAANRLCDILKGETDRAILVAAPRTLGVMRRHIDPELRARLIAEIDKDYTGRPAADIARMLGSFERSGP